MQKSVPLMMFSVSALAFSETISKEKVDAYMNSAPAASPAAPAERKANYDVMIWTPSLPISFSRLEYTNDKWSIGSSLTLGGSYAFMIGKGSDNIDGSINFSPQFFSGITGNYGLTRSTDENKEGIKSSLMLGLIVGFSQVSALGGYDFLTKSVVIGIGSQINVMTITDKLTYIIKK